jgi:hypothetical protein
MRLTDLRLWAAVPFGGARPGAVTIDKRLVEL